MTEKYKFLDNITSDVMYEAYGKDLKELFENAAEALFSVICKLDKVGPKKEERFEVKAENVEDLMVNFLSELIAIVDVEQMFFSRFEIEEIDEKHLIVKLKGEGISPEKGNTVVKAVTNYGYKFEKLPKGYKVTVSFDI